jgi:hypothetical protein
MGQICSWRLAPRCACKPAPPLLHPAALVAVFSLFPWSMLSKGFADLSKAAEGASPGISWAQRQSYCQASTPPAQLQEQLAYWVEGCTLPIGDALWILVGSWWSQSSGHELRPGL